MRAERLTAGETNESFLINEITDAISSTDVNITRCLAVTNSVAALEEFKHNPELTRPNNEYDNLKPDVVATNLATLDWVDERIAQASDIAQQQKQLLSMLSAYNRQRNDFLLANIEYYAANTPEEKLAAAKHHHEANELLYGKADEAVFEALLAEKLAKIDVDTLSPENRERYEWAVSEIGPLSNSEVGRFAPKEETVKIFSEYVKDFFGGFLAHIPKDKDVFTGDDMVKVVNEIIEEEFSDYPDANAIPYRAKVDPNAGSAMVKRPDIIFSAEKTYPREKAIGIIAHELGVHVLRSVPYLEQNVSAFSRGFPGYGTWEEGVAKCVEQAVVGKYEESGIEHYINIGLATFRGKNFREVYEIQRAINELLGKESDNQLLRQVQRCFRGTGELPNNDDLSYYNGSTMVWRYIEEHIDDPELFDNLFLVGKMDATNPAHMAVSYKARMGEFETQEVGYVEGVDDLPEDES